MYESGPWLGHWNQNGMGRQMMNDLVLVFEGNQITGNGWDCVGNFSYNGEVHESGEVRLVKKYDDRHSVVYFGQHDGEGTLHGVWTIESDNGTWAMRPQGGFRISDAPIGELLP